MHLEEHSLVVMNFEYAAVEIHRDIERSLLRAGLLCRVFSRGKSISSLRSKLEAVNEDGTKKYSPDGKKIQDAIGVRVVLYFSDDILLAENIISNNFEKSDGDCTVDIPGGSVFSATRYNLVYKLPGDIKNNLLSEIGGRAIDTTFEVQVRTILSEGWHEVEHDLRYKRKHYWDDYDDLARALNGVVATLETSEWSMQKIFEELCYKHYRARDWSAMITLKLRLRVDGELSGCLYAMLDEDEQLAKDIFRMDRGEVIRKFEMSRIPVSLDNAIYVWNFISLRCLVITSITPKIILDKLGETS